MPNLQLDSRRYIPDPNYPECFLTEKITREAQDMITALEIDNALAIKQLMFSSARELFESEDNLDD